MNEWISILTIVFLRLITGSYSWKLCRLCGIKLKEIMKESSCFLYLLLVSLVAAPAAASSAASPIAYNAILALVVVEVVFAFSVGIICIVFSFNLLRTLKETPTDQMDRLSVGNLPPSRPTRTLSTSSSPPLLPRVTNHSQDSEMDTEVPIPGYEPPPSESILQTFGNYLRWW